MTHLFQSTEEYFSPHNEVYNITAIYAAHLNGLTVDSPTNKWLSALNAARSDVNKSRYSCMKSSPTNSTFAAAEEAIIAVQEALSVTDDSDWVIVDMK